MGCVGTGASGSPSPRNRWWIACPSGYSSQRVGTEPIHLERSFAPLILRSMVEKCITITWILKAPAERAQMYIAYGLGQETLLLEQAKAGLQESGVDPDKDTEIVEWERWLNSQRYTFLTEVNVGNWGPTLREMAQEVDLLDLHRNDYSRWSSATHTCGIMSSDLTSQYCTNPLHGYHRVPLIQRLSLEPGFLQHAAGVYGYCDTELRRGRGINIDDLSAVEVLDLELQKIRWPLEREPGDRP